MLAPIWIAVVIAPRAAAAQPVAPAPAPALPPAPTATPTAVPAAAAPMRCWRDPAAQAGMPRVVACARECMGTECELTAFAADDAQVEAAFRKAFDELDRIEALMTTFRDTSTVARINAAAGGAAVPVDPDTMAVLKKSLWVAKLTGGAFDVTFGAWKGVWKFDQDKDETIPDPKLVAARKKLVNFRDLVLDEKKGTARLRRKGMAINLGGIAKGYAVDAAARVLRAAGLGNFMVHAGGDFYAAGRKGDRDWNVGIQDPRGSRHCPIQEAMRCVFAAVSLHDASFSTSGDYERFVMKDGKRYHHIIDPATGYPAQKSRSVTLLAKDAFTADALDTAILIVGPEKGMRIIEDLPDLEGVIVGADNRVHVSSGLKGRITIYHPPTDGP